jgi:hypothetical protein
MSTDTDTDENSIDELSKRRTARELDTLGAASRQMGAALAGIVNDLPVSSSLDGTNVLLIQAGLPEDATGMIGVPMSLLTQAAAHLFGCGLPDGMIRELFTKGVPFAGCGCNEPDCTRSPKRVQQTLRLLAYAIDEISVLMNGGVQEAISDEELIALTEKSTPVATVLMGVIVDSGMHKAFAF